MPNQIRERWSAFSEAAGVRKYIIAAFLATVIGALDRVEEWARQLLSRWMDVSVQVGDLEMVFGFPSWIVGLTVLFAMFWIWTLEYVVRLKRQLDPSIKITFEGKPPWVHPLKATTQSKHDSSKLVEAQSTFVRFKVENTTPDSVARGCEAFLAAVFRKNESGEFSQISSGDSLRLRWSAKPQDKIYGEIAIPHGVNQFCDLLSTDAEHNTILIKWDVSLSINRDIVSAPGIYRFDVIAVSANGGPVDKSIYSDWPGQWDQIKTWA